MSFGYTLFAIGETYLKITFALALSIKKTQKDNPKICVITNCQVPKEFKFVFDDVIYYTPKSENRFLGYDRAFIYDLSPYDETVHIESDSLVFDDLSHWWNIFRNNECYLKFARQMIGVDGNPIRHEKHPTHRLHCKINELPSDLRCAIFWFRKNEKTKILFDEVKNIYRYADTYLQKHSPHITFDLSSFDNLITLASVETKLYDEIVDRENIIKFCHAKKETCIEGYDLQNSWFENLFWEFDKFGNLKIDGCRQKYVFHYYRKDWIEKYFDLIINTLSLTKEENL